MGTEGYLRVESLSKVFAGRTALQNASFALAKGRALGLVGPSGSGKSTLARCIAGFETADSGAIWLDEQQIRPSAPLRSRFRVGSTPDTEPRP
jgi:ABC-type Fe3+/spermidine/putrescine transport system ATPase subunit